jgi:ABC-type Fe3+-hydroxamate transport system substrate-binding protein
MSVAPRLVAVLFLMMLLATGCRSAGNETSTTTVAPTTTTSAAVVTTTAPPVTMPNGDPVFAGYPKIVSVSDIDYRVAASYKDKLVDGQVVALAPGVYTPYNPNVPDLTDYLDGPSSGDCAARHKFFPNAGGSCWEGVK